MSFNNYICKKLPVFIIVFLLLLSASPVLALAILDLPDVSRMVSGRSRLIVTFKPQVDVGNQQRILSNFSAGRLKRLPLVNAQVVTLKSSQIENLRKTSGVLRVEEDVLVFTQRHRWWHRCWWRCPKPTPSPSPSPSPIPTPSPSPSPSPAPSAVPSPSSSPLPSLQPLPWGIDRIDAEKIWTTSTANTVKVAIIDTGVDLDHPDLAANIKGSTNTIYWWRSADDDNGHGSHVAGIVAAQNNTFGVVGVGPDIDLYAVKALNRRGTGYVSDIIEGLEWTIENGMNVVNMSFGTSSDVQSLHEAIIVAKNSGITLVAAAGNSGPSGDTVLYPAKYEEVIAVSATDSSDGQPSWSSRGPEVDLAAPGESVYSTYKRGKYKTLSGTSMAAPHVAGAAALVLATHPTFGPDQIQAHLQTTAENLGLSFNQQGFGLVDAEKASLTL